MTYASGFLCEFTFLDRFGIREGGEDLFKAKYIHVGILFLLFPVSILIPLVLKASLKHREVKRQHSSEIFVGEIVDLPFLVTGLSERSDPLFAFLSDHLDPKTKELMIEYRGQKSSAQKLELLLVKDLNRIISGPSIYDSKRFQAVTIKLSTQTLLNQAVREWKLTRLNRLLLEDAALLKCMSAQAELQIKNKIQLREDEQRRFDFRLPISTILSFFNISAVFYFLLFTPGDFFTAKERYIVLIIGVSMVGPGLIDLFVNSCIVPRFRKSRVYLRWIFLLFGIGGMDVFLFQGLFKDFAVLLWGPHIVPNGSIWYVMFIVMIPFVTWRCNNQAHKLKSLQSKYEIRLIGVSLSLMFFFLGIISFALRVYPFIPVSRGGGNYIEAPTVKLHFRPIPGVGSMLSTNSPVMLALSTSNSFVIIERTSTSIYLADTNDAGGPVAWRLMRKLPRIIEVRRDSIDQIAYAR